MQPNGQAIIFYAWLFFLGGLGIIRIALCTRNLNERDIGIIFRLPVGNAEIYL